MRVYIPNSAFLGNIDPFIQGLDLSSPYSLEITGNPKWISIHPIVLSMIGSLGIGMKWDGPKKIDLEAKSSHYLRRMGLHRMIGLEDNTAIMEHESAGRFIPLTQIKESDQLSRFIAEMVPLLHLAPEQAVPMKYIISELVRNVLEHSGSPHGAIVCAQYYKKSHSVKFGIADIGVGIRETITQAHYASSDLEAIRLALTPGITGMTRREGGTEQNAGAGLFFIRSIAKTNRDFFVMYSGSALYKMLKNTRYAKNGKLNANPFKDRHTALEGLPYWKGTVVGVDLSLSATEDFSSILDNINRTFVSTIRERKKSRYRRPRFE